MSEASEGSTQQFVNGGVIPNGLVGQNAVSKTYVDNQNLLMNADINIIASLAGTAQGTADTAVSSASAAQGTANSAAGAASTAQGSANMAQATADAHKVSLTAHSASNITYDGSVEGALNVKQAIDLAKQRVDNIIIGAGNSNLEIFEARGTFPMLSARLNDNDAQLADKAKMQGYGSPINKFGIKENPFLNFRRAVLKKSVNVTFWGDSITTGGDKLGVNSANPSGTEYAPNGIVNSEGYTHIISKGIAKSFPQATFNFYNRAIGGTNLNEWNTLKTIDSIEKTWIEHVKDTQPDLLFIGFGMNHLSYDLSKTYASSLKKVYEYIYANFTKIPDIVLVTSPTSVFNGSSWSDDINQESRRNTGKTARYFGLKYADYILDVSRYSDISRFGKDLESCYFEQKTTFSTTGTTDLATSGTSFIINEKCRDFTLKFILTATNITDGESILIKYNNDGTLNNQLMIYPNLGGVTKVYSYGRISDSANHTYLTDSYIHDSVISSQYWRIEKRENVLKVFIDDVPETIIVYDDKVDINNILGNITFVKQGGSVSTIKINNLTFFDPKYIGYKQTITEEEMWGKFVNNNYSTKPITGGNGANHPSARGVTQIYGVAIQEMISDIEKISKTHSEIDLELYRDDIVFTTNVSSVSGYCYVNLTPNQVPILQGIVYNSDKTLALKKNKSVGKPDDKTLLADNEFGIYLTADVIQIIFRNTMSANSTTQFKFNTYQFL